MRIPLSALALVACLTLTATGQIRNVKINTASKGQQEVCIAINPTNPLNMIVGANTNYAYHSFDGGLTWVERTLPQGTWGDPSVAFDRTGRAYYAHLTYGWDAITVRFSTNGGATWSGGTKVFGPSSDSARPGPYNESSLQDKEWIIADNSDGPLSGSVYMAWTNFTKYDSRLPHDSTCIVFARSTTQGVTFEPWVRVSDRGGDCIDSDNTVEGAVPAVGPGSEVYLVWSGPDGLVFDRSFDGGRTWGRDTVLTATPGGWDFAVSGLDRANGLPVAVADISGSPHRGSIYVNWADARHGDPDIFIMKSTDRGATWTAPLRVNDDPMGNGRVQFFTWMCCDPVTGELSIVYYDRRMYAGDSTDVWLARSTDGGASFTNTRISTSPFSPSPFVFFGDYNGIAAYGGRIRPVWSRMVNMVTSIHNAIIDPVTGIGEQDRGAINSPDASPWPNPMILGRDEWGHLPLGPAAGACSIHVVDHSGRTVAELHGPDAGTDRSEAVFRVADFAPGAYFYRVVSERDGASGGGAHRWGCFTVLR